ncbi:MAG TPA: hypothetical protein VMZ52_09845 [Bryobacteraceae bacterium]|nr:hypothetical protein [Bryobacteraceae bacterium]
MDWLNQIGGMLQQYAGASPDSAPATTEQDFDHVVQHAPPATVADGLAGAFRSDQTPPFANMLAGLFQQSNGSQRVGVLNTLLSVAGPALLSGGLSRFGSLGNLLGTQKEITAQQAEQISPQQVQELAKEAEKHDPSIVDRVSQVYAEHPTLIRTLGAGALALVMSNMAKQHRGLF